MNDRIVTPRIILKAEHEQRRLASRALEQLERLEPDLVTHLLEGLSIIQGRLFDAGIEPRKCRRLCRELESLAVVCVTAVRMGYQEFLPPVDGHGAEPEQPDPRQEPEAHE